MEFKFRDVDNRPPNQFPPSSFSSSSNFNMFSGQGFRPDPITLELEKAQIREEIIGSEIARRRALEAEVRRELMAEWEMEARLRARETSLFFEEHGLTMPLDPRLHFVPHFDKNHHRWLLEERFNIFPPPPPPHMLPPPVTEVLNTEVKDTSVGNKNKLIILAKPDPNRVVGAKRKTPPPAGAGELPMPLISLKKKPNEEWSCAICRVSATSEKGLTEHIQGRKHKANEARLKAQAMEKNSNTTTLPKKPRHLSKIVKMPITTGSGSETETEEKLPQLGENVDVSDQKLEDKEKFKGKKDELMVKREKKAKWLTKKLDHLKKKKHGLTAVDKAESASKLRDKKKYKFWCQICLVGAHSEVVMDSHTKGKKHIARLQELDKTNGAASATATTDTVSEQAKSDGSQMPNATTTTDTVTEKAKSDGSQMPNATTTTDTDTEQAKSDGPQMPKVTDGAANEGNEKLVDVQEADCSNSPPLVN
ncbi:hypothetical protein PTKIN_Ptkin19aG0118200 [Pterospermum kingtungense]